jgi:hypothetical protein
MRYRFLVEPFFQHGPHEKPTARLGCHKACDLELAAPFLRNGNLSVKNAIFIVALDKGQDPSFISWNSRNSPLEIS